MDFSACAGDVLFGPSVQGCRDNFDFTLKFEKIFFSILPSSIFIALCVLRIAVLLQRPHVVDGTWFRFTKAAAIVVAAALRLALLALVVHAKQLASYFIAAAVLNVVAVLCMMALSVFEHSRSRRPSILLSLYLIVAMLLDTAQTRSLWLASRTRHDVVFTRMFTAATAIWLLIFSLESISKRRWLRRDTVNHSPEETTGLLQLATLAWVLPLLRKGHRKILSMSDLGALDHNISTEVLHSHVANLGVDGFRGRKNALAKSVLRRLAIPLLIPLIPFLIQVTLSLCEPLLIQSLLKYLENPSASSKNTGYGLIGAAILIYLTTPFVFSLSGYYQARSLWMMRSVLIDAVYRKATTAQTSTSDDAKAITMMGTDVERIRLGMAGLHQLCWIPIQVAVSCWLLYRQLGAAFAAPIVLIICLCLASAVVTRMIRPRQTAWMERVETRVGSTTNIITNMKNIKISGLGRFIEDSIQSMRVKEIKAANKLRVVELLIVAAGFSPGALSAMFTFAVTAKDLDVTRIFTSVALLELLANPLNTLFQTMPSLLSALACLQRVQAFLETENRLDFREPTPSGLESKPGLSQLAQGSPIIEIAGGSFGWEPNKMVLENINASIFRGLNIIVGPVASGKTTLCKVFLSEIPFAKGNVYTSIPLRQVGFCDQTPVLFNASIKENIVGFGIVDEKRYAQAIYATMLSPDLEIFQHGDQTKIGSNGITLSGGQRQRVSIARAIYHECELYIFDDILSGLDTDTERHVFKHVFSSSGLLRKRNATVILCTHAVHYLPQSSHVIALSPNGEIVEQGCFDELVASEKYVHSLGVHTAKIKDDLEIERPPDKLELNSIDVTKSIKAESEDETEKDESRSSGDLSVFVHYFKSVGTISATIFMLSGVLCGFCWNFPNVWLAFWANDSSSAPQNHSNSYYLGIFSFLSCIRLSATILEIGLGYLVVAKNSGLNLHRDAIQTVIAAPLRFFVKTDVGIITNLFSQDITLIDSELPESLLNAAAMFWMVVGAAAIAATSSVYLLIGYPFLIVATYYLQRFYLSTSRQLRLLDLEAKSPLYTHFIDTMKGLATFRAFGWTEDAIIKNNAFVNNSTTPAYQLTMIQRWLFSTLKFLMGIIAVAIVTLATQLKSSSGFTGASMVALITFAGFLSAFINNYTLLETSLGAVNRLRAFRTKTEVEDLPGEDLIPSISWPDKGCVEIKGLSASYGQSPSSSTEALEKNEDVGVQALRDLNLTIQAGQKVAICGRTGSGKSSFILMLLRLLDPLPSSELKLSIDGYSITEVDRETLRQRLIAVPQEPVFLPNGTTFMYNLDPGHMATREECQATLEAVDLWSFVSERGGLDGSLSADFFSLGQKQLFSLARAILRRRVRFRLRMSETDTRGAKLPGVNLSLKSGADLHTDPISSGEDGGVLILDEYSSSLDVATDKVMQRIIREEFKGYTIIMVSHRLEMVMEFDRVIVLDTGRIVEDGVPKDLVEKGGSRFRELWMVRNSE